MGITVSRKVAGEAFGEETRPEVRTEGASRISQAEGRVSASMSACSGVVGAERVREGVGHRPCKASYDT